MALAQLIYVSRRTNGLTPEVLDTVIARTIVANRARDVTGMLLCSGRELLQVLEGELSVVAALFEKIRSDPRHSDVRCLLCKNVDKRMFPEWSMGLADLRAKSVLNRDRLTRMIDDVREHTDTAGRAVEARVILTDFRQQLARAA